MSTDLFLPPQPELMPCISLYMPWAQWVALGWKPIETRLHARFKRLKRERIGIHAGRTWDSSAIGHARNWLTEEQIEQTNAFSRDGGALIACAFVAGFRLLTAVDSKLALIDCKSVRRFGLCLADITPLSPCIPVRGRQGIFYMAAPESRAA